MAAVLDELRLHRPEPGPSCGRSWPNGSRHRHRCAVGCLSGRLVVSASRADCSPSARSSSSVRSRSGPATRPTRSTSRMRAATRWSSPPWRRRHPSRPRPRVPEARGSPRRGSAPLVAPSPSSRLQDYQAWMRLRVSGTRRLSQVTQRAISLTRGFGGYVTRSDVNVQGAHHGTAEVDVHIPIARVQDAIARFSSLGVIVGQHVAVADLQTAYDRAQRRGEALRHSLALIEVRLADPKVTPEQRVTTARAARAGASRAGGCQRDLDRACGSRRLRTSRSVVRDGSEGRPGRAAEARPPRARGAPGRWVARDDRDRRDLRADPGRAGAASRRTGRPGAPCPPPARRARAARAGLTAVSGGLPDGPLA